LSIAIVIALIPILLLAALGRGNWGHQVISLGFLLWLGTPLLIIVADFGRYLHKRRSISRNADSGSGTAAATGLAVQH